MSYTQPSSTISTPENSVQILFPISNGTRASGSKAAACAKRSLGRINLPRQSKTEIDWGCFPPCVTLRCRDAWITAYATVCGPEDIINGLINDVLSCIATGLVAAGISAIFASPAAALPVFEAAFKECLAKKIGNRIDEISVSLSIEEETGDWGPC